MTDARRLTRALTAAAIACLLAITAWPDPPSTSGADVLREWSAKAARR
jgi:hypothetical protein